jgi:hypothetical protein
MILRGLVDGSASGDWQKRELSKIMEGFEESFSTNTEKIPGVKIGFFLHTPFPSSEIYRYVRGPASDPTVLTNAQDPSRSPRNPPRYTLL